MFRHCFLCHFVKIQLWEMRQILILMRKMKEIAKIMWLVEASTGFQTQTGRLLCLCLTTSWHWVTEHPGGWNRYLIPDVFLRSEIFVFPQCIFQPRPKWAKWLIQHHELSPRAYNLALSITLNSVDWNLFRKSIKSNSTYPPQPDSPFGTKSKGGL